MKIFFYTILIYPIESLIELIYLIGFKILNGNIGGTILIISFFITLFTLPIYALAEKWQQKEREKQKKMQNKIIDIKSVFKGDERYMILSTYYRQNNYHPFFALRGSFSLFFQIPFFIAAYNFLSHLKSLHGASFLFVNNLAVPDALLNINGYSINLLPILMTSINIVSSYIYTKNFLLKDKLQLYVMALLFCILLYNSPSGLVIYWTLNNIFSLIKNIILNAKIKVKNIKKNLFKNTIIENDLNRNKLFIFNLLSLFLLLGIVIPSSLISSSVPEFSYTMQYANPFFLLYITSLQVIGMFFVWPIIIYFMASKNIKKVFTIFSCLILISAILNTFIFQGNYGSLSSLLTFTSDQALIHTKYEKLINIIVILSSFVLFFIVLKTKIAKAVIPLSLIIVLSFFTYGIINFIKIKSEFNKLTILLNRNQSIEKKNDENKVYSLSKKNKNIIYFMFDRMPGFFVPSIFEDFPEIAKDFEGFTLYPNTISFAGHTYKGAPCLFGGYEYTPKMVKKNTDENRDMYNESLCVLPRLFSENNWITTITDAALANHSWIPDNSIFIPYKNIKALNMEGKYVNEWIKKHNVQHDKNILPFSETLRNTIRFSIIKSSCYILRKKLYNKGHYLQSGTSTYGLMDYITKIAPLEFLQNNIKIEDKLNCFNLIVNNTSHTPLSIPQAQLFCRKELIKKAEYRCKNEITLNHYISDVYLFNIIGEFLRYLKDNNLYDNTKIIFVADHAMGNFILNNSKFNTDFKNKDLQQTYYMPILMIKDFSKRGNLNINMQFMTHADAPLLCLKNINDIEPKNPFTNKYFKETIDKENIMISNILENDDINIKLKNKYIFKEENWQKIE